MKTLEISYTREMTFNKQVRVSDKLAERLLKLDGECDLMEGNGSWCEDEEDTEEVEEGVWKCDDILSSDDFTLIAEDLTDIRDINDALNEIESIQVKEVKG